MYDVFRAYATLPRYVDQSVAAPPPCRQTWILSQIGNGFRFAAPFRKKYGRASKKTPLECRWNAQGNQ